MEEVSEGDRPLSLSNGRENGVGGAEGDVAREETIRNKYKTKTGECLTIIVSIWFRKL